MALLDLGCGDGALTASFAARFPEAEVLGIDASPAMIAVAGRQSAENLRFEHRRVQDIDATAEFDVAISIAALYRVPALDHPPVLASLYRALRRGGQFLAEFGGAGNVEATIDRLAQLRRPANTERPWRR